MAFCIECGAKVPDLAKFCPQCGTSVILGEAAPTDDSVAPVVEIASSPADLETLEATDAEDNASQEIEAEDLVSKVQIETRESNMAALDQSDSAPALEESLAAAAAPLNDGPKSKAGLLVGLGLLALIAAGGGAYAMGLFGAADKTLETKVSVPEISKPTPNPETQTETAVSSELDLVQDAYKQAILTGRISDLGEFARAYPESNLAKDAETAAFASLNRQNSVLAFKAFTEQFPNADTSSYAGPRVNSDVAPSEATTNAETSSVIAGEVSEPQSNIRVSITSRAAELEPFIEQGDIDYVLVVVDEMLSLADLSQDEATYLLNLRAKAETARGLAVPADPALNTGFETPVTEYSPPAAVAPVDVEPSLPFDTPAAPIERFGAITPDEATEPGECNMKFSINTTGTPTNIVPSCTHPILIEPAKEAVSDWLYTPASLNGVAVQQDGLTVTLKFHLE